MHDPWRRRVCRLLPHLHRDVRNRCRTYAAIAAATALAGCTSVARDASFPRVGELVASRGVEQRLHWDQGTEADAEAKAAVRALLERELTSDAAVQIALLNNPELQADYEDLGVAQADLVQAGLLSNPVFSAAGMPAVGASAGPKIELEITRAFLDLFLRPSRERIASAQLEEARLRVASRVLDVAAEVRAAFVELQGAQQTTELLRQVASTAGAGAEFAARLHAAGNLSELALASETALREQAELEALRAEADELEPRTRLSRLLGLTGAATAWRVRARLPAIPSSDPALDELVARARSERFDLAAARSEETALAEGLDSAESWRYLASADVGVRSEREPGEGFFVVGPTLSLELPIFDQRQAELSRLESRLRQSRLRAAALEVEVDSEVRLAHGRLQLARRLARQTRERLIPERERIVALSMRHYDFMHIGTFELLSAKQAEIAAYREYLTAVRDYWVARAELEHAVGARLPVDASETGTPAALEPAPATATDHAGHAAHSHGGH
jgi:cobalt-zinc-cadmium efflux system outer membrane protein